MKSSTEMRDALLSFVKESTPNGLQILIPVSGGSDSALVFWLYNQLFRDRTVGVFFGEMMRAEEWFAGTGVIRKMSLVDERDREVARWSECLRIALLENRILIGTRNRTEHELGVYSQASRVAYHLPIAGVWKSDVLAICELIGVPEDVIRSSRKADIDCGRPEEYAQIPLERVDAYTKSLIGESEDSLPLEEKHCEYLRGLFSRNRFKESLPRIGPRQ